MSGRHTHHQEEHDEAMEWIMDWDYERVLPSSGEQPQQPLPRHRRPKGTPTNSSVVSSDLLSTVVHGQGVDQTHDPRHGSGPTAVAGHTEEENDDDASMDIMDDDDDDDDTPLPLNHGVDSHPHHDSSQEIAIFWTRASEQLTDDDLNGMFGSANADHPAIGRRNSRLSLDGMLNVDETMGDDDEEEDEEIEETEAGVVLLQEREGSSTKPIVVESSASKAVLPPPSASRDDDGEDDEEEDEEYDDIIDDDVSIMGPLHEKEGLLPPMSPSQLYHQGNAQYGMIESHMIIHDNLKEAQSFPNDSTGTHTTVDLMDDEDEQSDIEDGDDVSLSPSLTTSRRHHPSSTVAAAGDDNASYAIFERQQQLLQEVLQQAPSSSATRRSTYELPRPSVHQQRLLQEMKERPNKKRASSESDAGTGGGGAPREDDPIFARQQEIFQQLRKQNQERKNEEQRALDAKVPHSSYAQYPPYHPHHTPYPYPSAASLSSASASYYPQGSSSSPVSVTKTLTRAGMDSEEYQKVVTRLTEKNLIERQRYMLQESMKRSLESRQALHIKPTALPDYNHDKLSRVLQDIESSTRSISETYRRR